MTEKIQINIRSNEGYDPSQIGRTITVGEIRRMLEDFDDDAEIITYDQNNQYGACWGIICPDFWPEIIDEENNEDQ